MKNILILLLSIAFMTSSFGQIIEANKPMSEGNNNALIVTLPDTEEKVVAKEWEKFIKGYKAKIKNIKKSDEIFGDDARLETISSNTVDVYAFTSQRGENTELTVWFNLGGAYLNSEAYPDKYQNAVTLLEDFSGIVSKTYIANMLNEEEDKLKGFEKNLKDIDKTQENAESDIKKYEEKIEEAKAAIEKAKADRVEAQRQIDEQKMVVKKVKTKLNN